MQDTGNKKSAEEKKQLWEEIRKNDGEIRRRLVTILEHPETPEEFRRHRVVQEIVK